MTISAHSPVERRYLGLRVGEHLFALERQKVLQIERADDLAASEEADSVGSLEIADGSRAEVRSLRAEFRLGDESTESRGHVAVVRGADRAIGLLVDRVVQIQGLDSAAVLSLPALARLAWGDQFRGVLAHEGGLTPIISPADLGRGVTVNSPNVEPRPAPLPETAEVDAQWRGRIITFTVGGSDARRSRFALSVRQVPEVAVGARIMQIETTAGAFVGLMSWRDQAIPVLDLAALAGLPSDPSSTPRTLVARTSTGDDIAFSVGPDTDVRRLPLENATPWRRELPVDRALVHSALEVDAAPLMLLNLESMLRATRSAIAATA